MNQILGTFQAFRTILCVCPCCGEIYRLGDLHLRYKGRAPKTWLDSYELKVKALEKKEEEFEEKEKSIREKAAERGRKKVDILIRESLEGGLSQFNYNPYDIKAVLHPVDFIVFDGMNNKGKVEDIMFLCKNTNAKDLKAMQKNVEKTVKKRSYEWSVARVEPGGNISYE